ncbi:G patch domain-containing protein 2-like isoform X2 [Gouania willdenowi]|uniref:G patch domain-containing protein 2-like isoform X2 n=1 Tax=Gouania willdenowi TaxID=441366 RepID=UPI00105627DD|nr:G patch domain-containing protein 2-like isoform X2 [Gouania willdenowi]
MMDELVQDLVSALEQTSEQAKLGEIWEEMVLNPLQQRRQIRRRRGRKRFRDASLYPMEHRRCWIEASESSLDESRNYRVNASSISASVANCSDSDDMVSTQPWPSILRGPVRTRQPSWPESDSFTENNPGRPLRRRRKMKRMSSDVGVRFQQKVKVSTVDRKRKHRSSKVQHLSESRRRSAGWMGVDRPPEGAQLMRKKCWRRKMAKEHRDADENMSEGETSSTCSSDPGLFTNDEGRQGDDEQSDWFVEGDCGTGVAGLLPSWDSDSQLSIDDKRTLPTFLQPSRQSSKAYHSRLRRLRGSAACCFRKERRRISRKGNSMPVFVERLRHFSQDSYQRDFWLPSVGKRDRSQLNPLCPLTMCPIDLLSENSHLRCSSSVFRNRQNNVTPGLLCSDTRRSSSREAESVTTSAINAFHLDHRRDETQGGENISILEAVGPSAPGPESPALTRPQSLF